MSHRTPTKTDFSDDWREGAACRDAVSVDPSLKTAWDNVDKGTWEKDNYQPDPKEGIARQMCLECPVRAMCLKDALFDNESEGIRGGFRFERGYVTKEDARALYREFKIRGKVKRATRSYLNGETDEEETNEVQ